MYFILFNSNASDYLGRVQASIRKNPAGHYLCTAYPGCQNAEREVRLSSPSYILVLCMFVNPKVKADNLWCFRLVVVLRQEIHIFSFPSKIERLHTIDTKDNPRGWCLLPVLNNCRQVPYFATLCWRFLCVNVSLPDMHNQCWGVQFTNY